MQDISKWVTPKVPEKTNWWNRKNLRNIGVGPSTSSIVAEVKPETPAARAGLQKGDDVTAIDGQKLYSPENIYDYVKDHPKGPYPAHRRARWCRLFPRRLRYDPLGVKVRDVGPDSPAKAAGLQEGDIIDGMDDQPTRDVTQLVDYVGQRAGVAITLHVRRGPPEPTRWPRLDRVAPRNLFGASTAASAPVTYAKLDLKVIPQIPITTDPDLKKHAKIGFAPEATDGWSFEGMGSYRTRPSIRVPLEQVRMSVAAIVNTLDAVMSRKSGVSVQHMGGPVMMMNAYYHMLSSPEGLRMAIWFSVVLNVNLALLNLLPIPVLDGGHITLAIIEAVRRKPMNVRILEYVQTACALVIISFMLFIMFFDIQDLPFVGGGRASYHFKTTEEAPK